MSKIFFMIQNVIKQKYAFFYISIIFLTRINFCFSKPTTSNGTSAVSQNEQENYRKSYAAQMLSYMNLSVDPCNDFYEYACGNWKNVIEERMSSRKRNNFADIEYKLDDIVESILQRSHINDVAPEYAAEFELAKKYYSNCLEAEIYPMRASSEYLSILQKIGGFPAVDTEWKSENFHWLKMSAHLSNYGVKNFIKEDLNSEYPFMPFFKFPDFGFDINLHNDTINNRSSNAYKENEKTMRNILTIYGVEVNRIDSIVSEIFKFLQKILEFMNIFYENEDFCILFSNYIDKSNIKKKWRMYNEIAWLDKGFENMTNKYEKCCTPCFYLYKKLDEIIEDNKRAAANYLSLKFLFHMDAHLQDIKFQKEYCISRIKSSMIFFFDHLFMKLYFDNGLRDEISYVFKEIRQSLRIIIQEAKWLDETTRKAALLKEATMGEHIGRYEDTNYTELLLRELKQLQFINGSYEANNLNLCKFEQYMKRFNGLNFEKLSNTTKPIELILGMQGNAFNYFANNSIYVMAGLLMPPIYNKFWPNSLKFGTLGYLIGHELTHNFDTLGTNFNVIGNNRTNLSNEFVKIIKKRDNCYVNHYKNFFVPEINRHINGDLTINENIADGGGLRQALMAYRRYMKNVTEDVGSALYKEEQIPGINLSPEQLFFLGSAQMWCASYTEANYWEEIMEEHPIDKFRVLGTLSNNADFAKAYSCPVDSKMNPSSSKCEVW